MFGDALPTITQDVVGLGETIVILPRPTRWLVESILPPMALHDDGGHVLVLAIGIVDYDFRTRIYAKSGLNIA